MGLRQFGEQAHYSRSDGEPHGQQWPERSTAYRQAQRPTMVHPSYRYRLGGLGADARFRPSLPDKGTVPAALEAFHWRSDASIQARCGPDGAWRAQHHPDLDGPTGNRSAHLGRQEELEGGPSRCSGSVRGLPAQQPGDKLHQAQSWTLPSGFFRPMPVRRRQGGLHGTLRSRPRGSALLPLWPLLLSLLRLRLPHALPRRQEQMLRVCLDVPSLGDPPLQVPKVVHWHLPTDIIAGSCLGTLIAVATYLIWWPSPFSSENYETMDTPRKTHLDLEEEEQLRLQDDDDYESEGLVGSGEERV